MKITPYTQQARTQNTQKFQTTQPNFKKHIVVKFPCGDESEKITTDLIYALREQALENILVLSIIKRRFADQQRTIGIYLNDGNKLASKTYKNMKRKLLNAVEKIDGEKNVYSAKKSESLKFHGDIQKAILSSTVEGIDDEDKIDWDN